MQGFPEVGDYKVVVETITYNHSKYIEDTLRGFAMQQTNFPFVCCIYDDASTDGEQEVLKKWVESHCNREDVVTYDHPLTIILMAPDKENPNCNYAIHLQKVNTWGKPEKKEMMSHWKTKCKYVALCEGDDYWTDPLKLQKQVDFLEANPEYGMCYTKVRRYDNTKRRFVGVFGGPSTTFEELLDRNTIPTLSILMRQELHQCYQEDIHPENKGWKMGDYPMWLWIAYNSKIHFIDEATGVYRVLPESASHSKEASRKVQFILNSFEIQVFYAECYMPDLKHHYDNRVLYWQAILLATQNELSKGLNILRQVQSKTLKDILRFGKYYILE